VQEQLRVAALEIGGDHRVAAKQVLEVALRARQDARQELLLLALAALLQGSGVEKDVLLALVVGETPRHVGLHTAVQSRGAQGLQNIRDPNSAALRECASRSFEVERPD
jgi:hypothetical protein